MSFRSCLLVVWFIGGFILKAHSQCLQYPIPLSQTIDASTTIIEGRVGPSHSFYTSDKSMIITAYSVEVLKVFKGQLSHDVIEVLQEGGTVGNRRIEVLPSVRLRPGDIGVFMLADYAAKDVQRSAPHTYKFSASEQSYYRYDAVDRLARSAFLDFALDGGSFYSRLEFLTGKEMEIVSSFDLNEYLLQDRTNDRMITGFTPATVSAGTNTVLTINGTNFGSTQGDVLFSFPSGGYALTDPLQIDSWTNTQIVVRVPDFAANGPIWVERSDGTDYFSNTDLDVTYAVNSYPGSPQDKFVRYVSPTTAGTMEMRMNTSFNSNTPAKESFLRAFTTWKCKSGIRFIMGATTTNNTNGNDNESVIRWANINELPAGTLGVYYGYFFGCGSIPQWYADEADLVFRQNGNGVTWEYGPALPASNEYDFESVALHELGHALILGHVKSSGDLMHPSISNGAYIRTPDQSAIDGALVSMPLHQGGGITCGGWHPLTPIPPIVVTNSGNSGAGSLRQAIVDVCPDSTIVFANSLSGSTINVVANPLDINKNMTIAGLGMNNLTLSGMNTNRIMDIDPGIEVTLKDLKLINGFAPVNGGAFYNEGHVILQNIWFVNNFQGLINKAFSMKPGSTMDLLSNINLTKSI